VAAASAKTALSEIVIVIVIPAASFNAITAMEVPLVAMVAAAVAVIIVRPEVMEWDVIPAMRRAGVVAAVITAIIIITNSAPTKNAFSE
jgi:hypothetical protein